MRFFDVICYCKNKKIYMESAARGLGKAPLTGNGMVTMQGSTKKTVQVQYEHAIESYPCMYLSINDNTQHWSVGDDIFALAIKQRYMELVDIEQFRLLMVIAAISNLRKREINDTEAKKSAESSIAKANRKRLASELTDQNVEIDFTDMANIYKYIRYAGVIGEKSTPYDQVGVAAGSNATFYGGTRDKQVTIVTRGPMPRNNIFTVHQTLIPGQLLFFIIKPVSLINIPDKTKWELLSIHRDISKKEENVYRRDPKFETLIDIIPWVSTSYELPEQWSLHEAMLPENYFEQPPLNNLSYKEWLRDKNGALELDKDNKPMFRLKKGRLIRAGYVSQLFNKLRDEPSSKQIVINEHLSLTEIKKLPMMEMCVDKEEYMV